MADAGWEFDFEKKEVKKIEEPENFKNQVMSEITDLVEDYITQKPAWSDEDELYLTYAILAAKKEWGADSCTANWLKSLKGRVQPKT